MFAALFAQVNTPSARFSLLAAFNAGGRRLVKGIQRYPEIVLTALPEKRQSPRYCHKNAINLCYGPVQMNGETMGNGEANRGGAQR